MKLVLLGAGASYGSGPTTPYNPPLGKDLFAKLESEGGVAATLPDDLKEAFKEDFESGMQRYTAFSNGTTMAFQRDLARFFAKFTPLEANEYQTLIKELGTRGIVYASLNYDLLFELSAGLQGLNTCYASKCASDSVSLLKIHGSCNFWPALPVGMLDGLTISAAIEDVGASVQPLDQQDTLYRCSKEKGLAPAIAHYAEGKAVKVSQAYVEEQLSQWKECAKKASKVAIIGVKVHQVDEHIWGVLGECKAQLWYVGFNADKRVFDEWKESYNKKNAYFIQSEFRDCISTIERRFKGNWGQAPIRN